MEKPVIDDQPVEEFINAMRAAQETEFKDPEVVKKAIAAAARVGAKISIQPI